jgi:hypothetical protein
MDIGAQSPGYTPGWDLFLEFDQERTFDHGIYCAPNKATRKVVPHGDTLPNNS